MTSMLASFAWRKANGEHPAIQNASSDDLGISASSSGESLGVQASEDSMFPQTPEGLRNRKSASSIREELGLPTRLSMDWNPQPRSIAQESPARSLLPPMKPEFLEDSRAGLPPILPNNSMPSPQVSTSSFYTRSTLTSKSVARSPSLVVGQARTAVGALLAFDSAAQSPSLAVGQAKTAVGALLVMSEHQHSFHQDSGKSIHSSNSILPPRRWDHNEAAAGDADDDSYSSMASQSNIHELQESDGESFSHASPSSNYFHNNKNKGNHHKHHPQALESSFSRSFVMDYSRIPSNPYDFQQKIEGPNLYVVPQPHIASSDDLNLSGISHSTKDIESLQSLADNVAIDEEMHSTCDEDMIGSDRQDIHSLTFSKTQRYDSDDLLFSSLERLQDNVTLVMEVLEKTKESNQVVLEEENFFTGFSKENRELICRVLNDILKEKPSRFQKTMEGKTDFERAIGFCSALVHIAVPPLEKPSKVQSSSFGVPQQGKWKCVPGCRAAIGLEEEPKSPDTIRGGDTSLFSLPSETVADLTPHTSNVSVTTTITSAFSPEKNDRFQFLRKNLRQSLESVVTLLDKLGDACTKLLTSTEVGSILTIMAAEEITRIYFQLQTVSVDNLEALVDSFELDVMPLPISRTISEDQGEDENLTCKVPRILPEKKPLTTVPPSSNIIVSQQLVSQTMRISTKGLPFNLVVDDDNDDTETHLFSPATADMASLEMSTRAPATNRIEDEEEDDLRRTVGSFDSEDAPEERESAPPAAPYVEPTQSQTRANAMKWKKPKRSLWRRKFSRKKSAE